jgi:hypothetical protein
MKIYKDDIKFFEKELKKIPWYTFNGDKRRFRRDLKIHINYLKRKISKNVFKNY